MFVLDEISYTDYHWVWFPIRFIYYSVLHDGYKFVSFQKESQYNAIMAKYMEQKLKNNNPLPQVS